MQDRSDQRASAVELSAITVAIVVLLLLEVFATKSSHLFSDPLWLDECLTHLLANDSNIHHEFAALMHGIDTTPPTYYFALRAVRLISGNLGAVGLRAFSFASIVFALGGIYAISRRAFDVVPSLIGLLLVASHQAVVEQMFEARHYGFWLLAIVACCYFQIDSGKTRRSLIAACVCAIAVTTIHWLGIVIVVMIGASDLLMRFRSPRKELFYRALPMLCGVVGTIASIPFLLGQRRGLTVPTWIDPVSMSQIRDVLQHLFACPPLICVILVYWIWRVIDRSPRATVQNDLSKFAATISLLVFPIALIVVSKVFQPMLLIRYVVPAIIPLAIMSAALTSEMTSRIGKLARIGLLIVLLVVGIGEVRNLGVSHRLRTDAMNADVGAVEQVVQEHGLLPVVFLRRLEHFPVLFIRPEFASDVAQIRFDQPMPFDLKRRTQYEQIMSARVESFYPQYQMIDFSKLLAMKHFYAINPGDGDESTSQIFAGAKIEPRGGDLFEITFP